jgi:adenine deaminase
MKKSLFAALLGAISLGVHADPMCVYQARISEADKTNSQGVYLPNSGVSVGTVAAIIRQDRANFHEFSIRDAEDESDCAFAKKSNRVTLENMLKNGEVDEAAMRTIVQGNPLIRVQVYRDHINITIVDRQAPRSSVK